VAVPVARGAFKITENESPRPQDRVSGAYNFYNNVNSVIDVHRETVAVEKTFLDGNASVGLRLPFFQAHQPGKNDSDVGDLTAILKYAFVNSDDTVLSGGLAVTAPTGPIPSVLVFTPFGVKELHSTLIQPFLGYYQAWGDLYVHGFSSLLVPTESKDVTLLFNSVGVGYWLCTGGERLSAVIPTFEAHVNTPLNHRGAPFGVADSVDLTAGSHFVFGQRTSLGVAVGTPVTGPRLFDFEVLVNLNWHF
jgi:hypothetical protein